MKKHALLAVILLQVLCASAQQLTIRKEKSQLYISHIVAPKESLYSLGRMYHLGPKEIAAANKLDAKAGLVIGQELKIPLNKNNFLQADSKQIKGLHPVYHTVAEGETLYRLSVTYNKVNKDLLRKWNGITDNVVKEGQPVIVGYMKYTPAAIPSDAPQEVASIPVNAKPKQSGPYHDRDEEGDIAETDYEPVKKQDAQFSTVSSTDEGFFSGEFAIHAGRQQKAIVGAAATFKSTSGWSDKKYYILVNDIPVETIVRITVNGHSVYAKVLETLPGLRDNNGLVCRISNAAAAALGISDPKFNVELSYAE